MSRRKPKPRLTNTALANQRTPGHQASMAPRVLREQITYSSPLLKGEKGSVADLGPIPQDGGSPVREFVSLLESVIDRLPVAWAGCMGSVLCAIC